jgi:hypothetical protein
MIVGVGVGVVVVAVEEVVTSIVTEQEGSLRSRRAQLGVKL